MAVSQVLQGSRQVTLFGPTGLMRPRKAIAAPDTRHFQKPRANIFIDEPKTTLKVPENKVRSQEAKILNIETKPLQPKKIVQNTKLLNKETNSLAQQTAIKKDIKRLIPKSPAGVNKLAMQKKKMLTALKTKAATELATEDTPSAPTTKKIANTSKLQIQKTKPLEQVIVEKNNLEIDISTTKKIVQENDTCIPIASGKSNITSVQDVKAEENKPTTKPALETAENIKAITEEKKCEDMPTNDKISASNPVEKPRTSPPKTEVSTAQKCELDPILARAVEDVLQDVMIQVWQELPDDPLQEEDRIAVDTLRNDAGDDLRRVLGLNITKRLLNVFNNLFVKVKFTCRPQMGCLTNFLKEYNISKFKRIDKNSNTFAAQMETIEDFDKLCGMKELICGEARVSVIPCYKFNQCPEELKTIYDDAHFYEDASQEHNESLKNNTQKSKVITSNENVEKPTAKVENVDASSTNKSDRTEIQKTANSERSNCEDVKKNSTIVDKEETSASSKIISSNNTKSNKKSTDNVTLEKEISKDIGKDNVISDYTLKDKSESDDDDFESGVPENQMEEEDELDDEDILALMSEGVVLDECSGSEGEE